METDDVRSYTRKCKYEVPVLDNLNVHYNTTNFKPFFFNKYQIFAYGNAELSYLENIFIPEFPIHLIIAYNNYLLCLDCNGNVHIFSLKFKSSILKTLNIPFLAREQGFKTSVRYKDDHALSIKYAAKAHYLCLNKVNSEFQLEKQVVLLCNDELWSLAQNSEEKYLLITHSVIKKNVQLFSKLYQVEEVPRNFSDMVLMSFDKHTIYGCLFSPNMPEDEVTLVKLYSTPAEICNMEIVDSEEFFLLIGLKMGTIIKLYFDATTKTPIVHLNTALYKMLSLEDCLLYTDGASIWKAENIFSDTITFTEFYPRNVKSFAKCGEKIICTTFSNMTYKFSINDETTQLIPETNDDYCLAVEVLDNSECLDKLFEEIDRNKELVKGLEKEQDYLTALSLSGRPDIVRNAIHSNISVYENYAEINTAECTLTEHTKEYFALNTWLFKITIANTNIYDTLNNILTHLSESVSIIITLSTTHTILKTTSIKMDEPLKKVCYLIPLDMNCVSPEIIVNIKIGLQIPGALDQKKSLSVLYRRDIVLTSEHFVKTSQKAALKSLKSNTESIKELIYKFNLVQYGNLFNFTDTSALDSFKYEWAFYVRLPKYFEEIFESAKNSKSHLSSKKFTDMMQELIASKTSMVLYVAKEKLTVQIHNDGFSNPLLKLTSADPKIAFNMRNFFANALYDEYDDYKPGMIFVGFSFYTITENFQKALKKWMKSSATLEEFLPLMDRFEKKIIGALPL